MKASHIIKESHKFPIIDQKPTMRPIIIQVAARLPKLTFTLSQAYALQDRSTLEQAAYDLANLSSFTGVPRLKRVAFFFLEVLHAAIGINIDAIYRYLLQTVNEVIETVRRLRARFPKGRA